MKFDIMQACPQCSSTAEKETLAAIVDSVSVTNRQGFNTRGSVNERRTIATEKANRIMASMPQRPIPAMSNTWLDLLVTCLCLLMLLSVILAIVLSYEVLSVGGSLVSVLDMELVRSQLMGRERTPERMQVATILYFVAVSAPLFVLLFSLWLRMWLRHRRHIAESNAQHYAVWEQEYLAWQRKLYCAKCGYTFYPTILR